MSKTRNVQNTKFKKSDPVRVTTMSFKVLNNFLVCILAFLERPL